MTAATLDQLRFDKQEHKYFVGGTELISVTTLLKAMGLVWYPYNEAVRLKMELGTYVHEIIEHYNKHLLDSSYPFRPERIYINEERRKAAGLHEALPYFEAYKKFLVDVDPEIISAERRMYHPQWHYAGTIDVEWRINGQLTLTDFKTGMAVPATELQMGGYGGLYQYWHNIMPKGSVLYLKGNGTYKLKEVPEMQTQSYTYLSALQIHQWKQRNNIKEYNEYE